MERNFYSRKLFGLSMQNEPSRDLVMTSNVRLYPDMLSTYEQFQKILNIKSSNFILSNGAENAIKNALLAVKCKKLSWSKPSWGFIDIYCKQLNIKSKCHKFSYKNNVFFEKDFDENIDVYYNTLNVNNFIFHQMNEKNMKKSRVNIIDISYLSLNQIKQLISQYDFKKSKDILVGSFDKLYGCGLRLGFAVFSDHFKKRMILQREIFINSVAASFINNFDYIQRQIDNFQKTCIKNDYVKKLQEFLDTTGYKYFLTNNYVSILKNIDTQVHCKKIQIGSQCITRFGIPYDNDEYQQIIQSLHK